jgi:lipopolysaccharide transport system ATP-binding protein
MASVVLDQVSVEFPIYSSSTRSFRNRLLRAATGGQLGVDPHGHMAVKALQELSCEFRDGDRIGLVGRNGAGKSTLLRVLNRVYEPSGGTAIINGDTGSLIDISLGIDHEATGRENIYLRGALLGLHQRQIDDRMEELVDFTELGNFVDLPLRTYSTGMHMRLAFAVSTLVQPQILLMDEWLSVGDEAFKAKAEKRMSDLVQKTSILVIATHSRELVCRICNRVLWLEHGRVKMDSDVKTVVEAYFGRAEAEAKA